MDVTCKHKWVFMGVVYWKSTHPKPGTGARDRIYGDKFFCDHCLTVQIINQRTHGTTYDKPIEGTFPK